jgi:hypothetical protein
MVQLAGGNNSGLFLLFISVWVRTMQQRAMTGGGGSAWVLEGTLHQGAMTGCRRRRRNMKNVGGVG